MTKLFNNLVIIFMDDDDDDDNHDDYYHHHNMATNVMVIYFCSDTLPLVDMYNLDGLKEIIVCNLRIEKCHLFHKVRVSQVQYWAVYFLVHLLLLFIIFLLNAFQVCIVSYALVIFLLDLWPM